MKRGDNSMRKFTFDDTDYIEKDGHYYYKVNYGKNKLEGEYAEDEIGYVEVTQVLPLGGVKLTPIPELQQRSEPMAYVPVDEAPVVEEKPKRGRPPKVKKLETSNETYVPAPQGGVQKYDYHVTYLGADNRENLEDELNKLGDVGWELCGFDTTKGMFGPMKIVAVFKRKRG